MFPEIGELFKKKENEPPLVVTSKPVPVKEIWEKPHQKTTLTVSIFGHVLVAVLLIIFVRPVRELVRSTATLILPANISDYLPQSKPAPKKAGGGGGGGDRSPLPASRGKLPKFSLKQFVPPTAVIQNPKPILPMEPTVVVPPDMQFTNPNLAQFGDPRGVLGQPSNGPGSGGGIGTGSGGGVGPGTGPGVGPGSGGGMGGGVFRVGGGVSAPQLIHRINPEYSEEARKAKHQGTVELYIEVDSMGRVIVERIKIRRSLGLGLDEKAIEAVKQWKFKPGMKDGKPVAVAALVTVHFRLL